MIRPRDLVPRVAGPISRRPLQVALGALLIGALGATGLLRFSVDAGQSLLVGSRSSAGQTYSAFSQTFGSDPIVLVFSTCTDNSGCQGLVNPTAQAIGNPFAPYYEGNLERLSALELDLVHDPRVASVLGPGTVAGSLRSAAVSEVSKVLTEYPYFIAETDYLSQLQAGNTNTTALNQRLQNDITTSTTLLELYVVKAASDAHNARAQYVSKTGDLVLDSQEKAVDAAIANDPVPPGWDQYLAGPGQPTNTAAAKQFFDRVASAYGDCDDQIATLLKIQPTCQYFFLRTLLDLPNCPKLSTALFCNPKPQWAAVLPAPQPNSPSYEIVTIRLKPQYVGGQAVATAGCPDPCNLATLQDKINGELAHGIASDAYTQKLSSTSLTTLKALGPLQPTQCGGQAAQQAPDCNNQFADKRMPYLMAGAPLLGTGVVRSMSQLLLILIPVALFVMLLLLIGVFRVRGRVWPLLAAAAATVLTIGVALLVGAGITPAVLAGVPVLVGLGVDYAVQLVARYTEERARGTPVEDAVSLVVRNTGGATLIAAAATLIGLGALALVSGIDWGPLVAVPLVAEFALVLCGGVVLAWLGGLFIALPLAVWSERRQPIVMNAGVAAAAEHRPALRTIALADNWTGVVALATLFAVLGWIALHFVSVQTDVQQLLASSLPELANIETVQSQTGYTNEIDIYLHGAVVSGTVDTRTGTPTSVEWQCSVAALIRTDHRDTVAAATSIGDYVIASGSATTGGAGDQCVPSTSTTPSPSPSPSASASATPTASATPSATAGATPSSTRATPSDVRTAAQIVAQETAATAAPTPTPTATPAASPTATPAASGSASPSASAGPTASPSPTTSTPIQSAFDCDLRLFPALARTLVMNISVDALSCPPVDEYQQTFLTKDSTPISPDSARIAIGVHTNSVADQAKLVDQLQSDIANSSPPGGVSAAPTGLAVLATTAYHNLVNGSYLLNLAPLLLVALVLLAIFRNPRRALLPVLPTALAAGWAPLLVLALGHLPGLPSDVATTLGSLNPLTVVLGALVVALGTEFGVVLLGRFYEERRRGLDPEAAAAAALGGVGRAIRVSALTLGAGFAVLAISGLFPNSLPLVADFGLAVVIDLALAVGAVFLVMLPVAVVLERRSPLAFAAAEATLAPATAPQPAPAAKQAQRKPRAATAKPKPQPDTAAAAATSDATPASQQPRRVPGVSGRRRPAPRDDTTAAAGPEETPPPPRRPGVSGRKRRRR